jgi:hypothetical protein
MESSQLLTATDASASHNTTDKRRVSHEAEDFKAKDSSHGLEYGSSLDVRDLQFMYQKG